MTIDDVKAVKEELETAGHYASANKILATLHERQVPGNKRGVLKHLRALGGAQGPSALRTQTAASRAVADSAAHSVADSAAIPVEDSAAMPAPDPAPADAGHLVPSAARPVANHSRVTSQATIVDPVVPAPSPECAVTPVSSVRVRAGQADHPRPWELGRVGRDPDEPLPTPGPRPPASGPPETHQSFLTSETTGARERSPAAPRSYPYGGVDAERPDYAPRPAPTSNGVLGPADQVQRALVAMQQSEVEQQVQSLPRAASLARNN